jgi:hypothetical protein
VFLGRVREEGGRRKEEEGGGQRRNEEERGGTRRKEGVLETKKIIPPASQQIFSPPKAGPRVPPRDSKIRPVRRCRGRKERKPKNVSGTEAPPEKIKNF